MNTQIINEVNQLLQTQMFHISLLRVIHGHLRASNSALSGLNAELKANVTDEQAADYHAPVVEYEDAANSTLASLQHYMDELKSSTSQTSLSLD